MNATETKSEVKEVVNGTKAPAKGDVASSIAEQLARDEQTIAAQNAEIVRLKAELAAKDAVTTPKGPVTDGQLQSTIDKLQAKAKADLSTPTPKASPDLSLTALLGIRPDFTAEQKKAWNVAKNSLVKAYSAKHRELLAERRKLFERAIRKDSTSVATVAKIRKDGTASNITLRAKEEAKPKKKKADAKPRQIAGNVPAAGNAINPATVS